MPRLSSIVGQQRAVESLRRAMRSGRVASAYLLSGPEGVGKRTLGVALAGALNCLDAPGEGCDGCASCSKIQGGHHPDLVVLERDGKFIKVEQVRALQQLLILAPNEGRSRAVIIDGAEHLHPSAGNALLKSVEEPRPDTVFVLVSSAAHRVLPTLRSRCQLLRLRPLSTAQVEEVVGRHAEHDDAGRAAAVAVAEGSPGRALRLLESDQLRAARAIAEGLLKAAAAGDGLTMFSISEQVGRDRETILEAVELLRIWLRDLMLLQASQSEERLIHRDRLDQLRAEAARTDYKTILARLRAVQQAHDALIGNVAPRLTAETLVLELSS